jgi:hypothetical protein
MRRFFAFSRINRFDIGPLQNWIKLLTFFRRIRGYTVFVIESRLPAINDLGCYHEILICPFKSRGTL